MLTTLAPLLLLGLLAMIWFSGARARETAVAIGRAACQKEGYQLLDDTVALQRFAPRWTPSGLRMRRMYRFEYSVEGTLRETGYVLLLGNRLESVHIRGRHTIDQSPEEEEAESRPVAKVIPFPGNRRR